MKKLFPEVPDVPQTVANRAVRIIEKHLKTHRVSRARDLPEEARIRLYRDLRFFFDSESRPASGGLPKRGFSIRSALSGFWEKIEDFLSACESHAPRRSAPTSPWPRSTASCGIATLVWLSGMRLSEQAN